MTKPDAQHHIGQRIARARKRRGLSQSVLAGLVGRSESWLSQVERGQRGVDSHSVINALANILGMRVEDLTTCEAGELMARYEAAAKIRQAMMGYEGLSVMIDPRKGEATPENMAWLRQELLSVNQLYQATRYDEAGRRLPGLIMATELAGRAAPARERRAYQGLRALTYHATATVLSRVGEPELAWTAGDRSLSAAEDAEEPLLAAVSAYRLGYVFVRLGESEKALHLAIRAAEALEGSARRLTQEQYSVLGGLYLVAVTAVAMRFDRAAVRTFLSHARRVADLVGTDRNDFWTAFGPTNVTIHEVSAAVAFADAKQAISKGEQLDVSDLAPGLLGRRAQVHLDLARAYAVQRKDAASVNMLLEAERISPELVRYDTRTNELLTQLIKREHRASTPALRGLAHRAGII
ncbi:transcriptional regulator with XRE-family HTH domain [Thermocatellispora tengchongensis]|uniref:Transcriptional regulator with XRE-family HTH domain n=1 Tax=Thermocatellispora tengchongensis TaxID=1073253 RepID=A0A840P4W6_9ACTN|nr:helix-turn-helix transcriptional regulator [Thermocatellispora tengchongensis]MBB5134718.1 transcriptional regulator with XRE-family HTH domain [Thermocatellispora tengchongensis]